MALTGPALAERWTPFFAIPGGAIYLDKDSVQRRSGQVSARLESTFPQPQALDRGGRMIIFVKMVESVSIDCKANVYKNVSRDLYDGNGARQISINEQDDPVLINPGTPQAALVKAFCS